ncbi:MAG: PEP-CTERM sorting domain-containing protein [Halorhodospira sp.]
MKKQPMLGIATSSAVVIGLLSAPAYATEFTIDPSGFDDFEDGPTEPLNSLGWELRTATQQFGTSNDEDYIPDAGSTFTDRGFGRIDAYNPYDIGDDEIVGLSQSDMTLRWDNITGTIGEDGQLSYDSGTIDFFFGGDGSIGSNELRSGDPFDTDSDEWQAAGSGERILSMELTGGDALADLELDDDDNLEIDATQFDLFFDITEADEDFWATADGDPFAELLAANVLITAFGEAGGATERNTVLNEDEGTFTDAEEELYTHYAGTRRGTVEFQVPEPSTLMLMGGSLILIALATTSGLRRFQSEGGRLAA